MHGWATIGRTPTRTVPYWEHAHSIPRVLTLKDGRVWQEPIQTPALRTCRQSFKNLTITIVESYVHGNANTIASFHDSTAQGIDLFAEGGSCTLESLELWRLRSAWD